MLGTTEIYELERLPKELQQILAVESEDPTFVTEFLVPALRTEDPYETIVSQIVREATASELAGMGLSDYGLGKSFFKRAAGAVKRIHKAVQKKIVPKAILKIHKKVGKVGKKVWRRYGSIIIMVVGAALTLLTGGAAGPVIAVLAAANTAYMNKRKADEAKKAGKTEAAAMAAESDKQMAELAAQVDQFYADNQPWFLEHGITPDKWAQLTLDQKVDIINAGAKGTLPVGIGPEVPGPEGQAPPQVQAPAPGAAPPGAPAWREPEAPPSPAEARAGTFDVLVEGNKLGTAATLEDAVAAALGATIPGDRFEIIAGGQSTGLRVRTADGSVDVPPDIEAQVRSMPRARMGEFVGDAEKAIAERGGGGFPWWLILGGGGLLKVAGVI